MAKRIRDATAYGFEFSFQPLFVCLGEGLKDNDAPLAKRTSAE
jgi:hypothetical protein